MNKLTAIEIAQLSAVAIESNLERYIQLINSNIKPPVLLKPDEVFIRAMYIISDSINSYGGRFDRTDLPAMAGLFIDSPVLIGHDKSGLPVARNFWAETVEKDGRLWIKSYFYWPKHAEGASKLALNIDAGIYKECSVSFVYALPECSACGKDIRSCGHQVSADVFFYYRGIEKILETSLVYRGAIPDTAITRDLSIAPESSKAFTLILPGLRSNPVAFSAKNETIRTRLDSRDFILIRGKG